jgi:hypothetical protein
MHDKNAAAGLCNSPHKISHKAIVISLVYTDAVFHRDGAVHSIAHGLNPLCHERGLIHQACAKGPFLDALAWAATVEIDLLIAPLDSDPSGSREILWLTPANL